MMNMMLKLGVALLAASVLTGCSKHISKESYGETTVISTNASTWDIPTNDDNPTQAYLEARYNIKLINMRGTDSNFKVKVASGEIPDIFSHHITEADMFNWAGLGVIATISIEEIKQYMPNYVASLEAINPNPWNVGMINGQHYGIPRNWLNGSYGFLPTYNGEWLRAIGYNQPPETIDELEDVLMKFRNHDPDGNGVKDTYGMSGRSRDVRTQMFNSIFAAYGINPYQFKVAEDGTITWGGITPQAKEALERLRNWYKSELIDPEFMMDDTALVDQKFLNQKIGFFDHKMYQHNYNGEQAAAEHNITQVYGRGLTGPGGENLVMSNGISQVPLLFGKQLEQDDAKRIRILKMLEDMISNDEVYLRTVFGIEGESYDIVDGSVVMKEEYRTSSDKARELGIGGYYNPLIERHSEMWKYHFTKESLAFRDHVNEGLNLITDALGPIVLHSKAKYLTSLNTLQDEFYIKAIIGNGDLGQEFEAFKTQWLKLGGKEMINEATTIYQQRLAVNE